MKETQKNELKELEKVVKKAFSICDNDLCGALKLIDNALPRIGFPYLDFCIREWLMFNNRQCQPNEKSVYEWFKENYKKHLGEEWHITKIKNNPKHIPDFWITNGITTIPVECKFNDFNGSALRQLERYMYHYGCTKGIAVAANLKVKLPKNIVFLKWDIES